MAKTGAGTKRQIHWGALIILLAGAVAFGLAIWTRFALHAGPTALEALIAENAPNENVQALTTAADGDLLVGTSIGVIKGSGKRWERLPGIAADVRSVAQMADGLVVAGGAAGIVWYRDEGPRELLGAPAAAIATPGGRRLVAVTNGRIVRQSPDVGWSWSQLAEFAAGEQILALAVNGERLAAGGLQGAIYESTDGGKTWNSLQAPGGSVTALLYDPSKAGRLWVAAGGGVLYSDNEGQSWRSGKRSSDRAVIALAPAAAGKSGLVGITPDGLLITISP